MYSKFAKDRVMDFKFLLVLFTIIQFGYCIFIYFRLFFLILTLSSVSDLSVFQVNCPDVTLYEEKFLNYLS